MPHREAVFSEMPFHLPPVGQQSFYGADIVSAVNISLEDNTIYGDYCFDPWYQTQAWRSKSVKLWSSDDVIHWITSVAREKNLCPTDLPADKFASFEGYQLSMLPESEFRNRDSKYGGMLYAKLQELLDKEEGRVPCHAGLVKSEESLEPTITSLDDEGDGDSRSTEEDERPPPPPEKKGRGRPRLPRKKKKTEKLGRLWEFLRDLLKNPQYCPSLIVWENYEEGMFRFVHSDQVAKLWGSKKENPDMNYEKLSRAMRYYYKSKVLMPVYGRRLVYKFGPNAKGWRVDNPNFVN